MAQQSKLSIFAFPGRDRRQANKALRLELKNRLYIELANYLNATEISII